MKYARLDDEDIAVEMIDDGGRSVETLFHKDIVKRLVPSEEGVLGKKWDGQSFVDVPIVE